MISRDILETADKCYRDIMNNLDSRFGTVPFRGKLIIYGSDSRQILSVVPKGGTKNIIQACCHERTCPQDRKKNTCLQEQKNK